MRGVCAVFVWTVIYVVMCACVVFSSLKSSSEAAVVSTSANFRVNPSRVL